VLVLFCIALAVGSAYCDDKDKLFGSWRLVAFRVQADDTRETKDAFGPQPLGRMILTAGGYITNYRVASSPKPALMPSALTLCAPWRPGRGDTKQDHAGAGRFPWWGFEG
jgi:hypothetical protein